MTSFALPLIVAHLFFVLQNKQTSCILNVVIESNLAELYFAQISFLPNPLKLEKDVSQTMKIFFSKDAACHNITYYKR